MKRNPLRKQALVRSLASPIPSRERFANEFVLESLAIKRWVHLLTNTKVGVRTMVAAQVEQENVG